MKIHILSDLHLEFAAFNPEPTDADVVVLAGDIDVRSSGVGWARDTFPDQEIIYVAGNHEFYGSQRLELISKLQEQCVLYEVHFLDDRAIQLQSANDKKPVRFLGATLWTDFLLFDDELREKCIMYGEMYLNDFRRIGDGRIGFSPQKSIQLHEQSLFFLRGELDVPFDGETVVITHHLPSMHSVAERYKPDLLSACFASELSYLFGKMSLWIHGHTHDSCDYEMNGTRVVCNPRGYVRSSHAENPEFNPSLIVEV
ncbi:metallophosphoesterase family protein [Polynucleobacter sp. JS-Fieb-80-E5]|jgi:predicted phosphodiesterase|uniref:metallophosphoesterase n=2 Tax=unclassified Polynucleobacter TaxID=2640945 RepID=UPI001C0BAEEB|nr:metallophosphoesterase family protein [Polynucleobacter sp. JS-Fieb-80-E5]MBU3617602.1 metallophosphoesterase [Polynucleobacter sp. JS-Fieb-80-E5]